MPRQGTEVPAPGLTPRQLGLWLSLLEHRTGVQVAADREAYVRTVLEKRMNECGVRQADTYLAQLAGGKDAQGDEWEVLLDRILIGETRFFRHRPSFDFVSDICKQWLGEADESPTITAWSLGCSTGEEPYSLAMTLARAYAEAGFRPSFSVIATDLNGRSLACAREGIYSPRALRGVDPELLEAFFEPRSSGDWQVTSRLRRRVTFFQGNVLDPQIPRRLRNLDVVYCQNLFIYLRRWRRRTLVRQLTGALRPGGLLIVGPGELSGWAPPELERHPDRSVQAYWLVA